MFSDQVALSTPYVSHSPMKVLKVPATCSPLCLVVFLAPSLNLFQKRCPLSDVLSAVLRPHTIVYPAHPLILPTHHSTCLSYQSSDRCVNVEWGIKVRKQTLRSMEGRRKYEQCRREGIEHGRLILVTGNIS